MNENQEIYEMLASECGENREEQAFPMQQEAYQSVTSLQQVSSGRKRRNRGKGKFLLAAFCCGLLGILLGAVSTAWLFRPDPAKEAAQEEEELTVMVEGLRENSVIQTVQVPTGEEMTAAQVYAANVNSTVGITTSVTTNIWGFQTTSAASGSGFIISTDGYILTNHHVIEGASSISVALYDGTTYEAALIGYDESNDIAVLKVEAQDLPPVILGDSDNLNVGDPVVAIGNPLGELTFSLTAGLVSAMNREVTMSSSVTMNLIQTDCAINSGNSGGALFNMYGEVIGVTNAKYSSSSASEASIDNIGFAIPVNTIRPIVESIIEKGYIARPYIGISVSDVSAETQLYGIPAGVAVQAVTEDAPAAQAGLQAGDVITAVNGIAMDSDALVEYVGSAAIGDTLTMEIYRQGQTLTLSVTVGEKIQSALANEEQTEQGMPGQFSTPESQGGFPFGGFSGRR